MAPDVVPHPAARRTFGLSARLFLITVGFVALAEVLLHVPALCGFRQDWLSDRVAEARVAMLANEAAPSGAVGDPLARRLLRRIGARAVVSYVQETERHLAPDGLPNEISGTVDLHDEGWSATVADTWRLLFASNPLPLRVVDPGIGSGERIEVYLEEAPLRAAMLDFAARVLLSSLVVAAAAAGLVFLTLRQVIVRPVRRLANSIMIFASDPERADRPAVASRRTDEIGDAETALARMKSSLAGELRQKRRLAELGLSVSKINHELRNLLTTAQLLSDRLEGVADPVVQRVAPRLVATLDRAIRFCQGTLAYGRAAEQTAERRMTQMASIFTDLPDAVGLPLRSGIDLRIAADQALMVDADPEQLSRALANLVRNAVESLETAGAASGSPRVSVSALRDGPPGTGRVTILVADNGPGLPDRAKHHLFAPFQGSVRSGGTGLGLAIAAELVALNGGILSLDPTETGAQFRIVVPDRRQGAGAA